MLGGQRARGMGGCPVWEGGGGRFQRLGRRTAYLGHIRCGWARVSVKAIFCLEGVVGVHAAPSQSGGQGVGGGGGGQQWTLHEQMQKPDQRSTAWAVREIAPMHPHPFVSVPGMQEPVVFSCWGQTGMSVQADGQLMGLEMGAEQRSAGTGYTSGCRVGNQPPHGST